MQFHRIADLPAFPGHRFPGWGMVPSEGELPVAEGDRLVAILRAHTATPDRCYLALWEGYGVPELNVTSLSLGDFQHPPNLWWPEDHAWCVATEIDLSETYLAASAACVEQVVSDPGLEAYEVPLEGRVDVDGDVVNPETL